MEETTQVEKCPETVLNELFPKEFNFIPKDVVSNRTFELSNFYITDGTEGAFELKKPVNPKVRTVNTYQITIEGEAIIRVKVPERALSSNIDLIEHYVQTKDAVLRSIAPYFHRYKIVNCRTTLSPTSKLVTTNHHGSYYIFIFKGEIFN